MNNLNKLSEYIYQQKQMKIHWLMGSCCFDITEMWCEGSYEDLEYSTSIVDCDILVVGTKLNQVEMNSIKKVLEMELSPQLVAFGNCSISGGNFADSSIISLERENIDIDLMIPGCAPTFENFSALLCSHLGILK